MRGAVLRHAHPGVHGETRVRQRQRRVEVELRDLGKVIGQQRETQEEVDERTLVRRGRSAEARDEAAGLAGAERRAAAFPYRSGDV